MDSLHSPKKKVTLETKMMHKLFSKTQTKCVISIVLLSPAGAISFRSWQRSDLLCGILRQEATTAGE